MSAVKYHVSPKTGPGVCRANKRKCRFGGDEKHYSSLADANLVYERMVAQENEGAEFGGTDGTQETVNSGDTGSGVVSTDTVSETATVENLEDRVKRTVESYSLVEERLVEEHENRFGKIPGRFLNKDVLMEGLERGFAEMQLYGEASKALLDELGSAPEVELLAARKKTLPPYLSFKAYEYHSEAWNKLIRSLGSKKDYGMPDEDVKAMITRLYGSAGVPNIERLDGWNSSSRAYGFYDPSGRYYVAYEAGAGSKAYAFPPCQYRYRSATGGIGEDHNAAFTPIDMKHLAGMYRAAKIMDGDDVEGMEPLRTHEPWEPHPATSPKSMFFAKREPDPNDNDTVNELKDNFYAAQIHQAVYDRFQEFRNEAEASRLQIKYLSNSRSGSSARAFEQKKGYTPEELARAEASTLRGAFRHVEIDGDVDMDKLADFEKDEVAIRGLMPSIPEGQEPDLRLRKLGRHKANGVFFPHVNTVAVDIRSSSSYIHEMGHYFDLQVGQNMSMQREFASIRQDYIKGLDESAAGGKRDYYSTPTEIFARGFEVYMHERKGVDNMLLDSERIKTRFDYAPFRDNPQMKERLFSIFDRLYANGLPDVDAHSGHNHSHSH